MRVTFFAAILSLAALLGCTTKLVVVGDREADVWVRNASAGTTSTDKYGTATYVGRAERPVDPKSEGPASRHVFEMNLPEELVEKNLEVSVRAAGWQWTYNVFSRKWQTITIRYPRADQVPEATAPAATSGPGGARSRAAAGGSGAVVPFTSPPGGEK